VGQSPLVPLARHRRCVLTLPGRRLPHPLRHSGQQALCAGDRDREPEGSVPVEKLRLVRSPKAREQGHSHFG
jgi:hypothetical protein